MGMRASERMAYIEDTVSRVGKITVTEISQNCGVTEETVRRDLDKLEEDGKITRVHGGAIPNLNYQTGGIGFYRRQTRNVSAKRRVGELALQILEGKTTIMADSSTTVVETLRQLADKPQYTIVTNSAGIFRSVESTLCSFISTGGVYNESSLSFQGEVAKENLKRFHVDVALISCKGIHMGSGILDSYNGEVDIKRAMIEQADEVAVLVDHTKLSRQAFLKVTDFDSIDYIITDMLPDPTWIEFCEEKGIKLIYGE